MRKGLQVQHTMSSPIGIEVKYLYTNGVVQRSRFCQHSLVEPLSGRCRPFQVSALVSKSEIGDDGCAGFLEFFGSKSKWHVSLTCRDVTHTSVAPFSQAWEATYKDDGHPYPPGQENYHDWHVDGAVIGPDIQITMNAGEGDDNVPTVSYGETIPINSILQMPPGVTMPGYPGGSALTRRPQQGRNTFVLKVSAALNPTLLAELQRKTREAEEGLRNLAEQKRAAQAK